MSSSTSEELHEAQRLNDQRDQEARLRAAIAVGIEAADRGDVVELTPELADQISRKPKPPCA